jgi:hypothetical protein
MSEVVRNAVSKFVSSLLVERRRSTSELKRVSHRFQPQVCKVVDTSHISNNINYNIVYHAVMSTDDRVWRCIRTDFEEGTHLADGEEDDP